MVCTFVRIKRQHLYDQRAKTPAGWRRLDGNQAYLFAYTSEFGSTLRTKLRYSLLAQSRCFFSLIRLNLLQMSRYTCIYWRRNGRGVATRRAFKRSTAYVPCQVEFSVNIPSGFLGTIILPPEYSSFERLFLCIASNNRTIRPQSWCANRESRKCESIDNNIL